LKKVFLLGKVSLSVEKSFMPAKKDLYWVEKSFKGKV